MRVFVAGGTGLVGSRLIGRLRTQGHDVLLLTRRPGVARDRFGDQAPVIEGDPMQPGDWMSALTDCDGAINLVGESIFARRWNESFIALLHDSRVKSTEHVVQALGRHPRTGTGSPKVLVNASAIGFYGPHEDEEITEKSPAGDDTLARLAQAWEKAAQPATSLGLRLALIRIGVVLDTEGALKKMLMPFKLGVGGPVGSGRQWFSWIHNEDVAGILVLALEHAQAAGPINATAPQPVTNKVFSKALGRALHRPSLLPVPGFALRARFGRVAEVLTTGQRVLPQRALEIGYHFKFPDVDRALQDILGGPTTTNTTNQTH
jgi:uncharacterized protein (TIGR01777 family)